MKMRRPPIFNVDPWILIIFLLLVALGWLSVCGASHSFDLESLFSFDTRAGKQLIWILCSLSLGAILLMLDEQYYDIIADVVYWTLMLLLLVTPFLARDIKGSRSWISLGVVSLQPAEFAKCATALALAKLLGHHDFALNTRRNFLRSLLLILLPLVLIILQKETGSALVYFAFFLVLYREGMPGSVLFCAFTAVVVFVLGISYSYTPLPYAHTSIGEFVVMLLIWIFSIGMLYIYLPRQPEHAQRVLFWGGLLQVGAYLLSVFVYPFDISWVQIGGLVLLLLYLGTHWIGQRIKSFLWISLFAVSSVSFLYVSEYALNNVMKDYQRTRIKVLLGIEEDKDASYNVNQSKIAIGSGGLLGKGFMNGTQTKLDYVPEQDTDFIFCTVGEEQGFLGASAVLLLYLALIWRLIVVAERQVYTFGRVFGYSVLSILLFHIAINIGMVLGLAPVIGIPLPFFSYGGSSLWGFTFLLFIFLRIDAGRNRR